MELLCRVLGHSFGQSRMEEEREEYDGTTELVVREYQTCQRCGTEVELYENRGLLSSEATEAKNDAGSVDGSDQSEDHAAADPESGETTAESKAPQDGVDDEESVPTKPVERGETSEETGVSDRRTEVDSNKTDQDEGSPAVTAHGESPSEAEESDTGEDDAVRDDGIIISETKTEQSPGTNGTDPPTDDAIILSDESADSDSNELSTDDSRGSSSKTDPDRATDPEPVADSTQSDRSERTDVSPTKPSRVRCGECGFEMAADDTSAQSGDLCTHCHDGYFKREP